jgi:hypothetical protein
MTVTKPKLKKGKWGAMHDKVRVVGQMLHNGEKPDVKTLAAQFKCTDKYVYLLIAQARRMTGITSRMTGIPKTPPTSGTQSKNPDLPLPLSNRKLRMQSSDPAREEVVAIFTSNKSILEQLDKPLPITMEEPKADMVNHPPHYTAGGIETIDFIQAKLTPEEFRGYLRGNILKYSSRAGLKGDAGEDLSKMVWYANKLKSLS